MIAIVLNTSSGGGRRGDVREEIVSLCRGAGVEARIEDVRDPRSISQVVYKALQRGADAIVAAGGDGTVSGTASVLAGTSIPLGVLPLGTLNHFARDAGIPSDLPKAVAVVAAKRTRNVDAARVNGHVFINNCSIGVYPDVVEGRERLRARGYPKWLALMRATAEVLRRGDAVAIRMAAGLSTGAPGAKVERAAIIARTPFVFVGNNEYVVEGIRIGARTRLDGGRLFAYFAPPVRTRDLPAMAAYAILRLRRHERRLQSIAAAELWMDTLRASEIHVACDGELLTLAAPLRFSAWPAALTLIAPA
jgi:diacylglycerol kinase family enzyme